MRCFHLLQTCHVLFVRRLNLFLDLIIKEYEMSILSKFGATWLSDEIASWSSNTSVQKGGGVLAAALLVFVSYRRYFNRVSRWNLPGPSQSILPIDIFDRTPNKYQLHLLLDNYVKKYGSIFAFCHQGHPVITVSDEKLIHKILWDEGHSFENRKVHAFL